MIYCYYIVTDRQLEAAICYTTICFSNPFEGQCPALFPQGCTCRAEAGRYPATCSQLLGGGYYKVGSLLDNHIALS